jgi:hypothetical protein
LLKLEHYQRLRQPDRRRAENETCAEHTEQSEYTKTMIGASKAVRQSRADAKLRKDHPCP